jgi:hypothetical protein
MEEGLWMSMDEKERRKPKITPKRTTTLQKLAYVVRPFVLYMLVKTAAMFVLAIALPALPITGAAVGGEQRASAQRGRQRRGKPDRGGFSAQ